MRLFASFIRTVRRRPAFTLLNFTGLYLGLTVSALVAVLLVHERHFDDFHEAPERIYRVACALGLETGETVHLPLAPGPLPSALKQEFPEVEELAAVRWRDEGVVHLGAGRIFSEKDLVFVDSAFFQLFRFVSAQQAVLLNRPGTVLLTQGAAARYFPGENALGRRFSLEIQGSKRMELEVAAIIPAAPNNSHLSYTMLISAASLPAASDAGGNWGWFQGGDFAYVRLIPTADPAAVGARLSELAMKRKDGRDNGRYTYTLQPMAEIHTDLKYAEYNPVYTVDPGQFYWLGAVGLFLLIVACINYVNLSTAVALRKAREIGVRKTLGASRGQLALAFLGETALLTVTAIALSSVTVHMLLPALNNFLERQVTVDWTSGLVLALLLLLVVFTTLLAGSYPALVLAGFNPAAALRSRFNARASRSSLTLRRGLVTFQFVVAQVFIAGVIVAALQMRYLQHKPLGFKRDAIVDINLPENKPEQVTTLKNRLAQLPGVRLVSFSSGAPVSDRQLGTIFNLRERFESGKLEVGIKLADPQYIETYGLELLAGRFINESDVQAAALSIPEDDRQYVAILNETAVRNLGFASPEEALGQVITVGLNHESPPIVGVVRDFHTTSLHAPVGSVVIMSGFEDFRRNLGLALEPAAANSATLAAVGKIWKELFPDALFESSFLDEHLASLYRQDQRTFTLFQLVALLALLINALGLIGLTAFIIEQKTKEIGVRKVLGASAASVVGLLTTDFLKLVALALVVSTPVAWWAMQQWLTDFAYRIDIRWWMFAAAGGVAIAAAFLTVSVQSFRAAVANPVQSLRNE